MSLALRLLGTSASRPTVERNVASVALVREGETIAIAAPLPAAMRARLQQGVEFARGIVAEDKGYSFTLHYRNAPSARERLRAHIDAVCAEFAIEPVEVMSGKAVFEVKRPGVSKGGTVRKLMTHPPFAGRTPIFIGDDETDKTLFAILPDYDGIGFSVDLEYPGLAGVFASPADVRRALAQLAAT